MSGITINIMSYRYGHLAAQAIESVLAQTKKPDKIVLVDDGVGDCFHLVGLYPEIEHRYNVRNEGIVDNFNKTLGLTKTDRVMFLGADNWLDPRALEKMTAHKEDIVSCDGWIWGKGMEYWELPYQPHGSALYDVKKAKKVGGYEASGRKKSEEDSVLFKRMMEAGASFHRVAEPLFYYRRHKWNFQK